MRTYCIPTHILVPFEKGAYACSAFLRMLLPSIYRSG